MNKHYIVAGKTMADCVTVLSIKAFDDRASADKLAKKLTNNRQYDAYDIGIYALVAVAEQNVPDIKITEVK